MTYTYLTHPQPIDTDILTHLRDHTHQTIRQLVTATGAHRSSVWRSVMRLAAKGKVARVKVNATGKVTYYLVS